MNTGPAIALVVCLFSLLMVGTRSAHGQGHLAVMELEAPAEQGIKRKAERLRAPAIAPEQRRDVRLTAQSVDEIREAMQQPQRGPRKIGFNRDLDEAGSGIDLRNELVWRLIEGGGQIAVLTVTSPSAMALRLAIVIEDLPEGAELRFFGRDSGEIYRATADEILGVIDMNLRAGDRGTDAVTYWSPLIDGEWIGLEVYLPPGAQLDDLVAFASSLSHLIYSPKSGQSALPVAMIGESASCNNDVSCYSDWTSTRNAVARMLFVKSGASYTCSGTLLNDVPGSFTPHFLSAYHCISTQSEASTLSTYWFYRSSSCGSAFVNASYVVRPGGATLLSTNPVTDTALLRLNEAPPAGAIYAGWSAAGPALATSVVGIHHPQGDLQKITFGAIEGYYNCTTPSLLAPFSCSPSSSTESNHIKVAYGSGIIEGGSSGSGAFLTTTAGLIGNLLGGTSSCVGPVNEGYYGRFDKAYTQGNLARWLNPSSFLLTVAKAGFGSGTVTSSPPGINCGSTCSAEFAPASSVTLTAAAADGSVFAGWSGACVGSASTCTVAMNSVQSVTATFNAAASLTNGQLIGGLSGPTNSYRYFYIDVPAGATDLEIQMAGGSGDADLYVRVGGEPTLTSYDCVSDSFGNGANCFFAAPVAGRYQILVYGYSAYSGANLEVNFSSSATYLENPYPGAKVSGIGLVSGWTCRSGVVEVSFNNGPRDNLVPTGSGRGDLLAICGRTDVGFGMLFNYNLLGPGTHTIQLFVNGQQVGSSVPFTVTVPAGEFIRGASKTVEVPDFPSPGKTTVLEWQESTQNFAISGVR